MAANTKPKPKYKQPGEVSLRDLILVPLIVILVLGYIIISMSTRNFTWFLPNNFTDRPDQIEIYHDGELTTLQPGDPGYDEMTNALNAQMTAIQGYNEVGVSPTALETYKERSVIVIMHYAEPLQINSRWNLGNPDRILIPITGANSGENRVYTGTENGYGHGGLILSDLSDFVATVEGLGFHE